MHQMTGFYQLVSARTARKFKAFCCYFSVIVFCYAQVVGCSAITLSPYQTPPMSKFPNAKPEEDLFIAVSPMIDSDDQIEYFGTKLTASGIIPIFVVAENKNPSKSFVLDEKSMTLIEKTTEHACKKPDKEDAATTSSGESMLGGSLICFLIMPIGLVPFIPLWLNGNKAIGDATAIHNGLVDKGFYVHTVSPGKSVSGFVYYKLPDADSDLKKLTMNIQAKELGTNAVHNFEFTF